MPLEYAPGGKRRYVEGADQLGTALCASRSYPNAKAERTLGPTKYHFQVSPSTTWDSDRTALADLHYTQRKTVLGQRLRLTSVWGAIIGLRAHLRNTPTLSNVDCLKFGLSHMGNPHGETVTFG